MHPSMRRTAALLLALTAGCATAQLPPLVPLTQVPEVRALPIDPAEEALPAGTPEGEWIEPLEAGSCYDTSGLRGGNQPCPRRSGLLSSEARAVRDGLYRIRYRELRSVVESDRTVWRAQRELYETMRRQDARALQAAQPSWLQRNALAIGLAAGFVVGVGGTVLILTR